MSSAPRRPQSGTLLRRTRRPHVRCAHLARRRQLPGVGHGRNPEWAIAGPALAGRGGAEPHRLRAAAAHHRPRTIPPVTALRRGHRRPSSSYSSPTPRPSPALPRVTVKYTAAQTAGNLNVIAWLGLERHLGGGHLGVTDPPAILPAAGGGTDHLPRSPQSIDLLRQEHPVGRGRSQRGEGGVQPGRCLRRHPDSGIRRDRPGQRPRRRRGRLRHRRHCRQWAVDHHQCQRPSLRRQHDLRRHQRRRNRIHQPRPSPSPTAISPRIALSTADRRATEPPQRSPRASPLGHAAGGLPGSSPSDSQPPSAPGCARARWRASSAQNRSRPGPPPPTTSAWPATPSSAAKDRAARPSPRSPRRPASPRPSATPASPPNTSYQLPGASQGRGRKPRAPTPTSPSATTSGQPAPTAPSTLTATDAVAGNRVDLSWTAASDDVGGDRVPDRALPGDRLQQLRRARRARRHRNHLQRHFRGHRDQLQLLRPSDRLCRQPGAVPKRRQRQHARPDT